MHQISLLDKSNFYRRSYFGKPKGIISVTVFVLLSVWFTLGVFPIKPLGVASGSMTPELYIGDLVLIKKCTANDVKIGDIILTANAQKIETDAALEEIVQTGDTITLELLRNNERRKIVEEIAGTAEFDRQIEKAENELNIVETRVELTNIILEELGKTIERWHVRTCSYIRSTCQYTHNTITIHPIIIRNSGYSSRWHNSKSARYKIRWINILIRATLNFNG